MGSILDGLSIHLSIGKRGLCRKYKKYHVGVYYRAGMNSPHNFGKIVQSIMDIEKELFIFG